MADYLGAKAMKDPKGMLADFIYARSERDMARFIKHWGLPRENYQLSQCLALRDKFERYWKHEHQQQYETWRGWQPHDWIETELEAILWEPVRYTDQGQHYARPAVAVDWAAQKLEPRPRDNLDLLALTVLKSRHLLKFCKQCHVPFLAARADRQICPYTCEAAARREAKLNWWKAHGKEWRASRKKQQRKDKLRGTKTRKP